MSTIDWNYERYRTRDRLVLPVIPQISTPLSILKKQILELAQLNGYTGEENEFWQHFANGNIFRGTAADFPIPGDEETLYFDSNSEILYFFKIVDDIEYTELIETVDSAIIDRSIIKDGETIHYLYIPVHAIVY